MKLNWRNQGCEVLANKNNLELQITSRSDSLVFHIKIVIV
jgi:hypothetical protein